MYVLQRQHGQLIWYLFLNLVFKTTRDVQTTEKFEFR